MSKETTVVKRNGSIEELDLNKLHLMVEESCKDLSGVSASQVEMQSGIQFIVALLQQRFKKFLLSLPLILLILIILIINL
jgi:ribonucleoside-diphosphate reductase alpha chain